jgi:carbonic anhydrase
MSCPNGTAPIDIKMVDNQRTCEYKCDYSFQYNNSSCTATNRGSYISLSYDPSSSPPVSYNSSGYDVKELRIYRPSLHSYSGNKVDAELIIIHNSVTGAKPLLVCIPINKNLSSNASSISAIFFKTVIDTMANNANRVDQTTTVNLNRYNLNSLIPKKPFFSYSGTEPYLPCNDNVDYIVFNSENGLDMLNETITRMNSIISSNSYTIKTGPELFYNKKGPTPWGGGGGEIYIDCQPVGKSNDYTEIINDKIASGSGSGSGYGSISGPQSLTEWLNTPAMKVLLATLVFIIILYGTRSLLNSFSATSKVASGFSSTKSK